MQNNSPSLIVGGQHIDERGALSFFNDFDMAKIKRFYIVEHCNRSVFRAWQGHQYEQKWFSVLLGAFQLAIVKPDIWEVPSKQIVPTAYRLSERVHQILHVPGGYVTGFCALESNSKMIVFSDKTLEESKLDDFRFDSNYWPRIGDIA